MSVFSVKVDTPRALDLITGSLATPASRWTHPTDYRPTQQFAAEARRAAIAAIRAPSARHAGGINLAVLDPAALIPPPRAHSSWALLAIGDDLLATREMSDQALRFTAKGFGIG